MELDLELRKLCDSLKLYPVHERLSFHEQGVVLQWRIVGLSGRLYFFEVDVPEKGGLASASQDASFPRIVSTQLTDSQTTTNMPAAIRNTVDRLDKPSAYYQSRVSFCYILLALWATIHWTNNVFLRSE